jgi:XamI-like restriction endonuclease
MTQPPRWSDEQLLTGMLKARDLFREERLQEPLEAYTRAFDQYQSAVAELLESSTNLVQLGQTWASIVTSPEMLEAFRYLAGPPISEDDLMVLAEARLSPTRLREDAKMAARVLNVVKVALDSRRFPWVVENRQPTPVERNAAVVASAALMATSRVGTARRNEGKGRQELMVRDALLSRNWIQVPPRPVTTFNQAPGPGEFCRESLLGSSKADFLIGLRDRRIMAIECKVSNSSTNSVKRLNREAAGKAEKWIYEFGVRNVVPVAVLSGVYKLHNVKSAQERGLIVYWAHDLTQLLDWMDTAS